MGKGITLNQAGRTCETTLLGLRPQEQHKRAQNDHDLEVAVKPSRLSTAVGMSRYRSSCLQCNAILREVDESLWFAI